MWLRSRIYVIIEYMILVTYLFDCCCVHGHKEYPIINNTTGCIPLKWFVFVKMWIPRVCYKLICTSRNESTVSKKINYSYISHVYLDIKCSGHEDDHSPPFRCEVNKVISHPFLGTRGTVHWCSYSFTITLNIQDRLEYFNLLGVYDIKIGWMA
jgi:hypothetical protein